MGKKMVEIEKIIEIVKVKKAFAEAESCSSGYERKEAYIQGVIDSCESIIKFLEKMEG